MNAVEHFRNRLAFETDVSDVHASLEERADFVLVDVRSVESWQQGHIPGAVHIPRRSIAAGVDIPPGTAIVTYCWGPGCNGATRAALEFALLGYPVREMLGGYEYWVREGFPAVTPTGTVRRPADDLTAPVAAISCAC
ncbi:MAG TPA: rhodanese-like domain-containing protein [Micromonosporaceae bacterium]|jgi:rhodanese-related sulfurtransferase